MSTTQNDCIGLRPNLRKTHSSIEHRQRLEALFRDKPQDILLRDMPFATPPPFRRDDLDHKEVALAACVTDVGNEVAFTAKCDGAAKVSIVGISLHFEPSGATDIVVRDQCFVAVDKIRR